MMSYLLIIAFLFASIERSSAQLDGAPPPLPNTGVRLYLGEEVRVLPDFSIISARQFHDGDRDSPGNPGTQDGLNDGLWCQSANTSNMIGTWYLPDGTQVSTVDDNNFPFHVFHVTGQIGLLRDAGIASIQGLYSCVIPDENGTDHTLWVAAYGVGDFDSSDMSLITSITRQTEFHLVSTSRDTDPPVFTLTFEVDRRPPTDVTCTVEVDDGGGLVKSDISYTDLSREVLVSEDPISIQVIVTIGMRQGGTYQCSVSNDVPNGNTATTQAVNVTVTDTPTNLTVMRIGLYQGIVSWSPPVSNNPVVLGYELFYDLPNGTRESIEVNDTLITFSTLDPESSYPVFVVAYGGDLPSSHSNNTNLKQAVSIEIPPSSTLLIGSNITVSCIVKITVEVTVAQVVWTDQDFNPINTIDGMDPMNDIMLSLDLVINDVQVSNAGVYTCGAKINDTLDNSAMSERHYTLNVEIPPPNVISLVTPGTQFGRTFLSSIPSLFCAGNITSIDLPPNIIFTWWGPQGLVTDDEKYDIQEGIAGDELQFGIDEEDYTHYSNLVIRDLTLMDNETQYYCIVQVGVNNTFDQSAYIIPGTTTSDNVTILVEALPVPIFTITREGAPVIGESFSIICNATIEDNLSPNINLTWIYNDSRSNGIIITSNSDGSLTLNVNPVQESHEGLYTCVATVTIPDVPQQIIRNETYDFSTLDDPDVSIIVTGSNIAGNMYTLTCEVGVVLGVPNITWMYNNTKIIEESGITLTLEENGLDSRLILQFSPLNYDHAGVYTCSANLTVQEFHFDGFNEASQTVNVQIPTPTVIITSDDMINIGTERSLTCNITLASYSPSSPNITIQWMKDGLVLDVSSERVDQSELQVNGNSYTSTITFSPLNSTDTGDYTCTGTISPIGSGFDVDVEPYIIGTNNDVSYTLTVQGIPDPVIIITAIGSNNISENYTLMCSVDIEDDLLNIQLNITFLRITDGSYQVLSYEESSGDAIIIVYFTPLMTSDSGRYRCSVDITQTTIDYQDVFYESFSVNTTIPTPDVIVTTDPPDVGTLVEGTYIDLVCAVTINDAVNTDVNVNIEWSRNGGSPLTNSSDYSISPIFLISDQYISTIRIEELITSDNGATFSCSVSIQPSSLSLYITGSNRESNITLSVEDFTDDNVMIIIDFPSIPTADDEFIFTCRATVPERLVHVPNGFTISYDLPGNEEVADDNSDATESSLMSNGNVFSRDITLNPVKTSDATNYFCIVVFEDLGTVIHTNRMLIVTISSPSMSIVLSNNDIIYESTSLNISCTATLPSAVNTPVSAMVSWINPSNEIITSTDDNRVTVLPAEMISTNIFESILIFYPVDNGDEGPFDDQGKYTCEMTISSTDNLLLNAVTSITENITVEELPPLQLNISTSGYTDLGQSFNITCSVRVVEGLVEQPNVTWMKMDDVSLGDLDDLNITTITVIDGPVTNVTIILDPVLFEHRGVYICMTEFNISLTLDGDSDSQEYELIVSLPPPDVIVTTDPSDVVTLVEGTYIDLVCTVTINDAVNIDVNVSIEWSRNGGSPLTNSSDYSISPISLVSDQYISTIRIEELMTSDNGATFSCSGNIQPSSLFLYITGSNRESSITLNVEDFTDNVMINIDFPSIPTAGDEFNFTCRATLPERLVHVPSDFTISYDLAGNMIVADDNSDATESPLMSNGNVFSRDITLNPVKTSDATNYFCIVVFEDLGTVTHNRMLSVTISSPNMSIVLSNNDIIYESTPLNISCTATLPSVVNTPVSAMVSWINPSNEIITSTDDNRVTVLPAEMISNNTFESILIFYPVDNGDEGPFDDQGKYTCEMTISSTDNLLLNGVTSITENITVEEIPPLQLNISTSGYTEVGLSFNMTCSVRVVEGLVEQPNVTWMKMDDVSMGDLDDLNISSITIIEGPVINVTVMLDPVLFEHRGVYICMAEFNISLTNDADSVSEEYELIVDFPSFTVDISRDYIGILYAGTPLTLTCNITLDDQVDIPVIVTNQWTRNMTNITEPTITESLIQTDTNRYTATLDFYPLSATYDNGEYKCTVLVTADDYTTNIINETSTDVVVEDLPNPEVVTDVRGFEIPGEPYNFTCIVTVVDRLIVSPVIEWSKESVSFISEENDITVYPKRYKDQLSLEFKFLNTSDAGEYTCDATVTVTEISVTVTNSSVEVLKLQIPVPSVVVTRTQEYDNLLAGSTLTIYCDITIVANVDTPFNVTTTWTHNNTVLVSNSRVTIIEPFSTDFNEYQSRIEFSTLSSTIDSGAYTCDVSVTSDSDYLYVIDAKNGNNTTTFTVINPVIGNFNAEPDDFLGLETSCLASLEYDKFYLSCMASKPEIVIPDLEVFWLHNGVERIDNSEVITNGTFVVNELNFTNSTANDTGDYTCVARIQIPYSTTIQLSEESTVVIRAARPPFVPVNVATTVTETTATITFIIPAIAYTPEMHYIQYIGQELQNVLRSSTPVTGSDDITVINATYNVMLTGLEEANTYEFTVVSTNCIGNATTEVMEFTTLSALPDNPPINCTNTTFDPRTVTLEWTEPERALQNGEISGYDLQCLMDGSDIPVPNVDDAQDNPDTNYTIPVLTPFTSYGCLLAAINEIGTGPNTTCVFMTAQDRPDDPPQNFTSTDTIVSVTFSWNPPTIPNGIITEYNLTVTNTTTGTSTSYNQSADTDNFTVRGFVPYQDYSATITAATVAGYGSIAEISGRTDPDISSPVILFTIPNRVTGGDFNDTLPSVNINTLNVTWLPPVTPNGLIEYYNIDVTNQEADQTRYPFYNFRVTSVEGQTRYTFLVTNLKGGVLYNITIGAVNEVGQGMNVSVLAFSSIQRLPTTICTSSCNRQPTDTQYQLCCDPINYGKFIEVMKENADKAYFVCPLEVPDWCNN